MPILADEKQIAAVVDRLADEVGSVMAALPGPWAFIGVRDHGDALANRLASRLKPEYLGALDITLYRDDVSQAGAGAAVRPTEINFPLDDVNVLLVDDVLMTGRSVRAALQLLVDFGRPRCVKLLVLVDRGRRELPIAPDFVGLRVNTDPGEHVAVHLKPADPSDRIIMKDEL